MATKKYKALLFHPDGKCVTDFYRKSIEEVWKEVEKMGSRWIFYPIVFVTTDRDFNIYTTVVDTPEGLEYFKRKSAWTVKKYLEEQWKNRKGEICDAINAGMPYDIVFNLPPKNF